MGICEICGKNEGGPFLNFCSICIGLVEEEKQAVNKMKKRM